MTANAEIVHQMPGRVRLRIPDKRRDVSFFSKLSEELSGIGDVLKVKVNPITGSLVIEFSCSMQDLFNLMREQTSGIDIKYKLQNGRSRSMQKSASMPILNLVSGREITPLFMIGSILTILGVVQTFRGKILGPAVSTFWYARDAFRHAGKERK